MRSGKFVLTSQRFKIIGEPMQSGCRLLKLAQNESHFLQLKVTDSWACVPNIIQINFAYYFFNMLAVGANSSKIVIHIRAK